MIFGPDGKKITKSGSTYFTKNGIISKSGNMYFGPNGQRASESGSTVFTKQGAFHCSGNTFFAPNGMYHLSGSTLYGPHGKMWSGVGSVDDAKVVILDDLTK